MAVDTIEKSIGQIQKLKSYLPEKTQEELEQILAYGEKMKVEGKRKKREFWVSHNREDFMKLLRYKWKNKKEIERQYKYLDIIKGLEREKFIEEYLHDDVLYSGKQEELNVKVKKYSYNAWKKGKVVMEDGVKLDFCHKKLGLKGTKDIVENIKLKEGVELDLSSNQIGAEGAKAIAEKMKLKEGVHLNLNLNEIGDEGAEAIAKMELKEGVCLDLRINDIGAEGAKAIAEKMKLKEGVHLNLASNGIGVEGAKEIAKMELEEGVYIDLQNNEIGDEGAKALAEKMKLKKGVKLDLGDNQIGNEGVEAISKIELREGCGLGFGNNQIGDEGAELIMKNMELKEGVTLHLKYNNISENMKDELKKWEKSYHDKGINCKVEV